MINNHHCPKSETYCYSEVVSPSLFRLQYFSVLCCHCFIKTFHLPAEFDALLRLGIPDPCTYIKKRFKSNKLLFLRAACVGQTLVDQVEASVEEAVSSDTWTDIQVL